MMNKKAKVFAFYSTKGGVGKSNLCAGLVKRLANNKKVNILVLNTDYSSYSMLTLLNCLDLVQDQHFFYRDLKRSGLMESLKTLEYVQTKYIFIDMAGFELEGKELSEIQEYIDMWLLPFVVEDSSQTVAPAMIKDMHKSGIPYEKMCFFINHVRTHYPKHLYIGLDKYLRKFEEKGVHVLPAIDYMKNLNTGDAKTFKNKSFSNLVNFVKEQSK